MEKLAWGLWTHDEVELIRDTYFPKATVNELRLFLTLAAKRGLEPGIQLIAVKFKTQDGGERATFITPIDGYRSLADRTGNYAGSDECLFDDGLTEYQHIVSTKEKPITATATVCKVVGGMRVPFVATVRWDEYYPTLKNKQFMWDKMPYLMLGKCAEALALRKAFPEQMSGIYTDTEMEQAYGGELVEPAKKPPTVNKPDQKALPPQKPANDKRNAYKPDELIKALNKTVRDYPSQGLDQFIVGLIEIGQESDERPAGKERGHDEDERQHGAVPEGAVVQDGKNGAVGPEENDADGQAEIGQKAGAVVVLLSILGRVSRLAQSQEAIYLVSRSGLVIAAR